MNYELFTESGSLGNESENSFSVQCLNSPKIIFEIPETHVCHLYQLFATSNIKVDIVKRDCFHYYLFTINSVYHNLVFMLNLIL